MSQPAPESPQPQGVPRLPMRTMTLVEDIAADDPRNPTSQHMVLMHILTPLGELTFWLDADHCSNLARDFKRFATAARTGLVTPKPSLIVPGR